jgi:hypothetical protein
MLLLDIDADGDIDTFGDCLTILKYVVGVRGAGLTDGTVLPTAPRHDPQEIEDYIRNIWYFLDVDGNGEVNTEDAVMIMLYRAGLRGVNLVGGRLSAGGVRNTAALVEAYCAHILSDLQKLSI